MLFSSNFLLSTLSNPTKLEARSSLQKESMHLRSFLKSSNAHGLISMLHRSKHAKVRYRRTFATVSRVIPSEIRGGGFRINFNFVQNPLSRGFSKHLLNENVFNKPELTNLFSIKFIVYWEKSQIVVFGQGGEVGSTQPAGCVDRCAGRWEPVSCAFKLSAEPRSAL